MQSATECNVSRPRDERQLLAVDMRKPFLGPPTRRGRGVRTSADVRSGRRQDVATRYPQGATDEDLAAAWGVTKTTIAKDRRAMGVSARPTGRRPQSPLPEERACE